MTFELLKEILQLHTSHLNQLANTALKAAYHSKIFTRAATKHEAVRTMIC